MYLNFYQPPCALLNPQVFATVKAFLSRLWTELKRSEAYKEFLFWLHNAGKPDLATTGWLFGFSPNELDAFRFVIENGLKYQNSSWCVAWVNENRPKLVDLRHEVNDYFTRQQLAVFGSRTGFKSLGYYLYCFKRFVTNTITEAPSVLAEQALRVQTPGIIEKYAANNGETVDSVNEEIAKHKKQFPEETDLAILYYYAAGHSGTIYRSKAPVPLWKVIHKRAIRIVQSTGKPLGVVKATQQLYSVLTDGPLDG